MAGDGLVKPNRGWWIISNRPRAISFLYAGGRQQSVFTPFRRCGRTIRYQAVHSDEVEDILALDILCGVTTPSGMSIYRRRSTASGAQALLRPFYVLCLPSGLHLKKGVDVHALKEQMLELLQQAARNTLPNITSVICIKHRRRAEVLSRERSDQQYESGDR